MYFLVCFFFRSNKKPSQFPRCSVHFNLLMQSYCFHRLHWGGSRLRRWSWAFTAQSPSLAWRCWWRVRTGRTACCLGRFQPSLPPADPPLLMQSVVRSLHFSFVLCLLAWMRGSKVSRHIFILRQMMRIRSSSNFGIQNLHIASQRTTWLNYDLFNLSASRLSVTKYEYV